MKSIPYRVANMCHTVCTVKLHSTGRWSINIVRQPAGAGSIQDQVHNLLSDIVLFPSQNQSAKTSIHWKAAGLVVLFLPAERLLQ